MSSNTGIPSESYLLIGIALFIGLVTIYFATKKILKEDGTITDDENEEEESNNSNNAIIAGTVGAIS